MGLEKGSYAMNHCWHDTRSCPVRANCSFMEGHFTCVAWCNLALGANITLLFSSLNNQGIVNSCVATFFIMKKESQEMHWRIIAEKKFSQNVDSEFQNYEFICLMKRRLSRHVTKALYPATGRDAQRPAHELFDKTDNSYLQSDHCILWIIVDRYRCSGKYLQKVLTISLSLTVVFLFHLLLLFTIF